MIRIKILIHLGEQEITQAIDTVKNLELLANNGVILRKGDILSFSNADIARNMDNKFFEKELRKVDDVVFFSASHTSYENYDAVVSYYLVH